MSIYGTRKHVSHAVRRRRSARVRVYAHTRVRGKTRGVLNYMHSRNLRRFTLPGVRARFNASCLRIEREKETARCALFTGPLRIMRTYRFSLRQYLFLNRVSLRAQINSIALRKLCQKSKRIFTKRMKRILLAHRGILGPSM